MANDCLKSLETEYLNKNLKFDFVKKANENEYSFVLNNCAESDLFTIIKCLKYECLKRKVKQLEIQGLPGLKKLLNKTNTIFQHDLDNLQSK